jgi:hypothetical protein
MLKRLLIAAALVLAYALAAAGEVRVGLGGSVNPAGLQNALDVSWRRDLSRSHGALVADAHVSAGVSSRLTPAYARVGPWVELAPLSVVEVRTGLEAVGYFGTFHSLLSYAGYGERFDDHSRKLRDDARSGLGARGYVAPTLKGRVGPLVFRSRAEFEWWTVRVPGPYVYEPSRDTLLRASGDGLVATETLLLWAFHEDGPRRLMAGPIHEMTLVHDYAGNRRQLVGVVAVWGTGRRLFGLTDPMVLAKVSRYVEDPYREGRVAVQLGLSAGIRSR